MKCGRRRPGRWPSARVRDGWCRCAICRSSDAFVLRWHAGGPGYRWQWCGPRRTARDQYFGNARVGSLIDALAVPVEELRFGTLVPICANWAATCSYNQTHERWWERCVRRAGWRGSNFVFAASPELARARVTEELCRRSFQTAPRGWPIHLWLCAGGCVRLTDHVSKNPS